MSKRIVSTLRHHSKFFHYYFLVVAFVPLIIFSLYSLLPPKVNAANLTSTQKLDQPIILTIWGLLDRESLLINTSPPTPVKFVWKKELIPLKNTVEIKPDGLFVPNFTYTFDIQVNNRLGFKSSRSLGFKTNSVPQIKSSSLGSFSSDIGPRTKFSFTFSELPKSGEVVFSSYPKFEYTQKIEGNRLTIIPKKLKQKQDYLVNAYLKSQKRFFGPILKKNFSTVAPLELTSSQPTSGEETVLKQATINLTFNKTLTKSSLESKVKISPNIELKYNWKDDKSVEIIPINLLQPNTKYQVSLEDSLAAQDSSELQEVLTLGFTTAGPVKISQFHPSGGYPYINTPIEITFNQPVEPKSAQERFSISPNIEGSFSWVGNKLVFKPKSLLISKVYTVSITPGVKSIGGEDSVETFTSSFTTTSEVTKVIGRSVQGRAITATYFGVGPKKVLLVASMHGSEANTGAMLTSWINYLRNNQSQIGSDRTFIIIPYLNPDGKAANKRFNANNVDLNRNWGAPDWQSLTYWQNRSYPNGGGSSPFSEPETRALQNLVISEKPALTITYHSSANVVLGDGISENFGDWYANLTGYVRSKNTEEEERSMSALGYIVTGTYEDWASRQGIVTLIVEFISATANEYQRNYPALRGLLTYGL